MGEPAAVRPAEPPPHPGARMIDDVDRTLRRLIEEKIPRPRRQFIVKFDQPSEGWGVDNALTVNLFLYDVRENLDLRDPTPVFEPSSDGTTIRRQPPARIDLFYVVTTWTAATQGNETQLFDEHRLLSDVLRTLLRYPTIPRDVLQGSLVGQEPPLPTMVAQMGDGLPHPPAEFWSALQSPMRPSLNLIVTIALEPAATDPAVRLLPVATGELAAGVRGGQLLRLRVRPPFRGGLEAGEDISIASLAAASAGSLAQPVRASDRLIDVADGAQLEANQWIRITDGPNAATNDFVRITLRPQPGPATVPVEPPLRFPHPSGRSVDRISLASAPRTFLGAAGATAGANAIPVEERSGLQTGDLLLIDDLERSEFVRLTNANPGTQGPGSLAVAPTLRFVHDPGRPLRVAAVLPAATTLSLAVNQAVNAVTFAAPPPALPPGTPVMLGAGDHVEFAVLGAGAGANRPVSPALRDNHPVGAPVRALTSEELVARLARRVAAGEVEILVGGDPPPELRLGDVIRIGSAAPPSYHEIVSLSAEPGVLADADRFVDVFGRVLDRTSPERPIPGTAVTLVRPAAGGQPEERLTSTRSGAEGEFRFRNVAPGAYLLRVEAARFDLQDKPVTVPSTRFDEYVVRLTPN